MVRKTPKNLVGRALFFIGKSHNRLCKSPALFRSRGQSVDALLELPRLLRSQPEDEDLTGRVTLAHFEVLERQSAGNGRCRSPVDAPPVDLDPQVGLDGARRDAPILCELDRAVRPRGSRSDFNA